MRGTKWQLPITKQQYIEIYAGLPEVLSQINLFESTYTTDEEFLYTYMSAKMWRMNNLYYIIDKIGDKVRFEMNLAQHLKYAAQLRHPRVLVLKSRQRGISTGTLVDYNDDALFNENILVGMQSYGLEESAALLEKLQVIWFSLPEDVIDFMGLVITKNNTKSMAYSNGSEVKVQTSFRGSTLQRLHVSELGKIANKDPKKAKELKSGTLQAIKMGNPVTIESTAEGQHNAMHTWWLEAIELVGERSLKDFFPLFLTWVTDPDCLIDTKLLISAEDEAILEKIELEYGEYIEVPSFRLSDQQKWWAVAQMRELGDDFFQEYPHTPEAAFNAVHDGAYYARHWRKHGRVVKEGLYDPALSVQTAWDLGRNDMMVIVFFQRYGDEFRIIDCYYNHGESLKHYVSVLKERIASKGYFYSRHIFPHDVKVAELQSNKTRLYALRKLGLKNIKVVKRTTNVLNDIEIVRGQIQNIIVDNSTAKYIIKMFGRYTKKWDEVLGVFKDEPLHDTWSNPADGVRYMVMGSLSKAEMKPKKVPKPKPDSSDGLAL